MGRYRNCRNCQKLYHSGNDTGIQLRIICNCGRSIDKAEQFKEKFGFEKAYGSYKELLDDPEVEAVYIALPNTLHYEWAVKAMESGKHVLCEKPLAPCEKQVKELFDTAKENHVYLMEAFALSAQSIYR